MSSPSKWVGQYGMSFGKINFEPPSYLLWGKWFTNESFNNLQQSKNSTSVYIKYYACWNKAICKYLTKAWIHAFPNNLKGCFYKTWMISYHIFTHIDIILMICDLNGNSYFFVYFTMCFITYVNVILMHIYMEPTMVRYEFIFEGRVLGNWEIWSYQGVNIVTKVKVMVLSINECFKSFWQTFLWYYVNRIIQIKANNMGFSQIPLEEMLSIFTIFLRLLCN